MMRPRWNRLRGSWVALALVAPVAAAGVAGGAQALAAENDGPSTVETLVGVLGGTACDGREVLDLGAATYVDPRGRPVDSRVPKGSKLRQFGGTLLGFTDLPSVPVSVDMYCRPPAGTSIEQARARQAAVERQEARLAALRRKAAREGGHR